MMIRPVLLILLAWGLLAAPMLCLGGSVQHDCECGAEIDCAHEEECEDDPCADVLGLPQLDSVSLPALQAETLDFDPVPARAEVLPPTDALRTRPNLPYPPDQLPLLN